VPSLTQPFWNQPPMASAVDGAHNGEALQGSRPAFPLLERMKQLCSKE
jgi:hypothetical protein